jgi:hypothetical protein
MKLLFNTIQTRPNSVSSQSVRSEDEEHKEKHKTHSTPTTGGRVLTAPKSVNSTGRHGGIMSAHDEKKTGTSEEAKAATPQHTEAEIARFIDALTKTGIEKDKKAKAEAQIDVIKAKKAYEDAVTAASGDATKETAALDTYKGILKKHLDLLPPKGDGTKYTAAEIDPATFKATDIESIFYNPFIGTADEAGLKAQITAFDKEITKFDPDAKLGLALFNRKEGMTEEKGKTLFAEKKFGSGFWGTAVIAAVMASLGAIGAKMLGDSSVKAAEEKAKAADDKVTALQEQIQSILQQLGQVMQAMQAKGDKSTAQLTNLVARVLKLQQKAMGAASTPAYGSVASARVASRTVRSDDNSPASAPPNLDELEKQVAALEKQQSQGSKPPSPQESPHGESQQPSNSSGGDKQSGGGFKMPQLPGMPQGGGNQNAGSPPVQQQPQPPQQYEQPRVRIHHRPPEDSSNGMVPIVLGDTRRKFSNTGNNVLYEETDGDD